MLIFFPEDLDGGLSERFFLLVDYNDTANNLTYRVKMRMSGAQDKSEDQLLAAVTEIYTAYHS